MARAAAQKVARGNHPERPQLCFRVGISGHRPKPDKQPDAWRDRALEQLEAIYAEIDDTLRHVWWESGELYSQAAPTVRLVSGLAEGADQLAVAAMAHRNARIASAIVGADQPLRWKLDAVLPFPRESYKEDFRQSAADPSKSVVGAFEDALKKATSVTELPDDPRVVRHELSPTQDEKEYWRARNAGYARLANFLVRQIDVLIAIWDGQPEEGPGGTAQVVRSAVALGIPVVWISTRQQVFPTLVDAIQTDGKPIAPLADCLRGRLGEKVRAIVALPAGAAHDAHGPSVSVEKRVADFLGETWPEPSRWTAYDRFKRWVEQKPQRSRVPVESFDSIVEEWTNFTQKAPQAGALATQIRSTLAKRYAWADVLAVDYANKYRSAYITVYAMAWIAVVVALLGALSNEPWIPHEGALAYKFVLVAIETILIWRIIIIVKVGRREERWQERWVEYRTLAEMLRNARFLAYLGEYGYIQRADDLEPASSAWILWYLRATIRELGIPSGELDGAYLYKHLGATEQHVIQGQLDYNRAAAPGLEKMHNRLHRLGDFSFLATFVVLAIFLGFAGLYFFLMLTQGVSPLELMGFGHHESGDHRAHAPVLAFATGLGAVLLAIKTYITVLAAMLPAFGAAIAGIRETGDFEGFAERAKKTAASLSEIEADIRQAKLSLELDATSNVLLATAQVLTEDVGTWQSIYGRKRLDLPA